MVKQPRMSVFAYPVAVALMLFGEVLRRVLDHFDPPPERERV